MDSRAGKVYTQRSINPAILSQLGKAFQSKVQLGTHMKDMLEYNNCFQGQHGVVYILFI
jgi:hypothetical protein